MPIHLDIRNDSKRKWMYRSDVLLSLAKRFCNEEGLEGDIEISLLFCDDPFIKQLNREYRNKNEPTDVLSFTQDRVGVGTLCILGDIVISLETVESHCSSERSAMRDEVRLLFCHGLLHLVGYVHDSPKQRDLMQEKQSQYLGISKEAAWRTGPTI